MPSAAFTSSISALEGLPDEILTEIVLNLVASHFLGPPKELIPLIMVSKSVYKKLSMQWNPSLYSSIFQHKFDCQASIERFGEKNGHAKRRTAELARRFGSLRRLRNARSSLWTIDTLQDDLWTVYIIFLEHEDKNYQQLTDYYEVDQLVFDLLVGDGPFRPISGERIGIDHETRALGAWIFWFTDKARVAKESIDTRRLVQRALAPIFIAAYNYTSTHAPITSFMIPPTSRQPTPEYLLSGAAVPPLSSLPAPAASTFREYFGTDVTLAHPLLSPAALLSCVVRLELDEAEAQVILPEGVPATRAEATTIGWDNPTRQDYEEKMRPATRFVDWDSTTHGFSWGRHNHDWERLLRCYDPWKQVTAVTPGVRQVFTRGMLDGEWVELADVPLTDIPIHVHSMMMKFRIVEHHHYSRDTMVDFHDISHDGRGDGIFKAWLPKGAHLTLSPELEELLVHVPGKSTTVYKTYNPVSAYHHAKNEGSYASDEDPGFYGDGIYDIILTATTDSDYSQAWGPQAYVGRVRAWDGLVVLVQLATESENAVVFSGYVHGGQNLVGRWRESNIATPMEDPGWEGVWSMSKLE
ncbi:hypothetical protein K439DRAFT_854639 [Ramaria rubella]|nr:hypothetical protein K439DRAFT_854639 [Ramaria rubella]